MEMLGNMAWYQKSCEDFSITKLDNGECFIWAGDNILLVFEKHTDNHQLQLGFNSDEDIIYVIGVDEV